MDVDEEGASAAQTFHDLIKDKADISEVTGEHIAVFEDVNVTTPRCATIFVRRVLSLETDSGMRLTEVDSISTCSKTSSDYEGRCTTTRSSTPLSPGSSSFQNPTMSTLPSS